ncbi:MAG TPA: DNA-3-methyladenine glycosylase [Gemmatimonadales bacterium]|nr:DNA-3-methyladenine glycosylase [Gemmatimonadales bacterium]
MGNTVPQVLTPGRLRAGVAFLRRTDPVLGRAMDALGPCRFEANGQGTHFDALIRAIVYQQLSGKAAATILARVLEQFDGNFPTPLELLAANEADLRSAGLSRQKLSYLRDLAQHVADGTLMLDDVELLPDDEIERQLVMVKGIGRWSAQIFLMFRLGRPDVLPSADLGIRKGIQALHSLPELPTPAEVAERGQVWAPYRSLASWYLWRLVDTKTVADGA